jgi:hypothetical protein
VSNAAASATASETAGRLVVEAVDEVDDLATDSLTTADGGAAAVGLLDDDATADDGAVVEDDGLAIGSLAIADGGAAVVGAVVNFSAGALVGGSERTIGVVVGSGALIDGRALYVDFLFAITVAHVCSTVLTVSS